MNANSWGKMREKSIKDEKNGQERFLWKIWPVNSLDLSPEWQRKEFSLRQMQVK